jgi:hypothetical protein
MEWVKAMMATSGSHSSTTAISMTTAKLRETPIMALRWPRARPLQQKLILRRH